MSTHLAPVLRGSWTAQLMQLQSILQRSSQSRPLDWLPTPVARFAVALYFPLIALAGVVAGDGALGIGTDMHDVGLGWTPGKPSSASASGTLSASSDASGTPSGATADRGIFIIAIGVFVVGLVSALMILVVIYIRRIIHTRTLLAPLRSQNPSLYWRILFSNDDPSLAALGHSPPAGDTLNLEALQKLDTERSLPHSGDGLGDTPHTEPCSVCLDPLFTANKVIRRLPCGHKFHTTCVDAWLVQRRGVCPVCRRDLTVKESAAGTDRERGSCDESERAMTMTMRDSGTSQEVPSEAPIAIPTPSALARLVTRLGLGRTMRAAARSDVEMGDGVQGGLPAHVLLDTQIGASEGTLSPPASQSRGELESVMLVHSVAR